MNIMNKLYTKNVFFINIEHVDFVLTLSSRVSFSQTSFFGIHIYRLGQYLFSIFSFIRSMPGPALLLTLFTVSII
jgi:hypothetical protein